MPINDVLTEIISNEGHNNKQELTPYLMFKYAIKTEITRKYYERRLKKFFDFIEFQITQPYIEVRCNKFADKSKDNTNWALSQIIRFLQYQKERVENKEITSGTLKNFVKSLKVFCEMADISIPWKKITRRLPKTRRYADDRAPTREEIIKISEYPDRRIKTIIYIMSSSGIRLGSWNYLQFKHIKPIEKGGKIIAAKIIFYAGEDDEYFSFITPEAHYELQKWMDFRTKSGEEINENSWVMRQLWDTKKGYYHHGTIKNPIKLKCSGIKRLIKIAL